MLRDPAAVRKAEKDALGSSGGGGRLLGGSSANGNDGGTVDGLTQRVGRARTVTRTRRPQAARR